MNDSTKTLRIQNINSEGIAQSIEIKFNSPQNLLELLNAHNVGINQSCGGFGICTTCRVIVQSGQPNLSVPIEIESERAQERLFLSNERLCCQTELVGDVEISIPNYFSEKT